MRGAVISLGSTSSVMVAEAMKKYFDHVDMIQLKNIEVHLGKEAKVLYRGKELEKYDCVYAKGSFRYAQLLRSISSMLSKKVAYMPLPPFSYTIVHNKLLSHLVMEQHNIPMPNTYISPTVDAAKELLQIVNYPIVMKFPQGTQGKGVMFADSISSASSVLDALDSLNQPFLIQEYIETGGTDIRALVVGDKVVTAMQRTATAEEKRANIHAGGSGQAILLSRACINIALDTAKALQSDICGVDILEGPRGPVVIEANISPGLQGLQTCSTIDIADEIARFLFRKTEGKSAGVRKQAAADVMRDININQTASEEIISSLQLRGNKILLPEFVTNITGFDDRKEYTIKAKKDSLEIKKFDI